MCRLEVEGGIAVCVWQFSSLLPTTVSQFPDCLYALLTFLLSNFHNCFITIFQHKPLKFQSLIDSFGLGFLNCHHFSWIGSNFQSTPSRWNISNCNCHHFKLLFAQHKIFFFFLISHHYNYFLKFTCQLGYNFSDVIR